MKATLGVLLLFASLAVFASGYCYLYGTHIIWVNLVKDYYANVSSSLASIAVTILLIDYLNERRARHELLLQLVREAGSSDNAFAIRALVELRARGWLTNGSIAGVTLDAANLHSADLRSADLSQTSLAAADLSSVVATSATFAGAVITAANFAGGAFENADLSNCDLRWSDFTGADLSGACLNGARLDGAVFTGCNVTERQLHSAASYEDVVLPDGSRPPRSGGSLEVANAGGTGQSLNLRIP